MASPLAAFVLTPAGQYETYVIVSVLRASEERALGRNTHTHTHEGILFAPDCVPLQKKNETQEAGSQTAGC